MSRRNRRSRRRSADTEVLLLATFLLCGAFKPIASLFIAVLCAGIILLAAALLVYSYRMWTRTTNRSRLATLTDVDVIGGLKFEAYVADLLRRHGYQKVSLTERLDFGVDIIAERNGERWGIQTKRYTGRVGEYAVKQVVTGLKYYHCTRAMVITNSNYTSRAEKLAESNGCVLVDRAKLARLISHATSAQRRDPPIARSARWHAATHF
jgi:restriction system protein